MSLRLETSAGPLVALPLTGASGDYDELLELADDARLVLLGEASHGTHEFYRERALLTRRLIAERGFHGVAAEADWPDAYRVNCYVRGRDADRSAEQALGDFRRFPAWMWRNTVVRDFVAWLRRHNDELPPGAPKAGFYGLDLYSLSSSIRAVLDYLDGVDPEAAKRARARYACLEHFQADPQRYGFAVYTGAVDPCEDQVVAQLVELQRHAAAQGAAGGPASEEEQFVAEQNARLAKNAEQYYRMMFRGRTASWNLRDTHMADTLDALLRFLDRQVGRARLVVWAHNSHLGDARATELGAAGELNLGQLARERHGDAALLVGFSTYTGTVTAADDWDEPGQTMDVRPGLPGSYEALLHEASAGGGPSHFLLNLRERANAAILTAERLERAIGVVYRPASERYSHYFGASLSRQFDALIYIDETSAVAPLELAQEVGGPEPPETFPSGT